MPIFPFDDEKLTQELIDRVGVVQSRILTIIAANIEDEIDSDNWRVIQSRKINQLLRQISEELGTLTPDAIRDVLEQAYQLGIDSADADANEAASNGARGVRQAIERASSAELVGTPVIGASQYGLIALVTQMNTELDDVKESILRTVRDDYRAIVSRVIDDNLIGTETRRQAAQRALNDFAQQGITAFRDQAGRRWELESYVEMATRTATGRAKMYGHAARQLEYGFDLVQTSFHSDSSDTCRPYQNKVYSLSGTSDRFPPYQRALQGGFQHPNCRHTISTYFEGYSELVKETPPAAQIKEQYDERQQQRQIERNIRKWKKRAAVSITPQERQKAQAKTREWQTVMREFIDDTGRTRARRREQLKGVR